MRAIGFSPRCRPGMGHQDGSGGAPVSGQPDATRRTRAAAPVGLLAAGVGGATWVYGHNPHLPGQPLLFCPWHRLTGLQCPACGATRMVFDLMHRHLTAAWHDNAALLLALPLVGWLCLTWLRHGLAGNVWRYRPSRRARAVILAVAVAWTIARNLIGA